jgi:hypothetical protein
MSQQQDWRFFDGNLGADTLDDDDLDIIFDGEGEVIRASLHGTGYYRYWTIIARHSEARHHFLNPSLLAWWGYTVHIKSSVYNE